MNIQSIRVIGLFEEFDHTINLRMRERITILHGPNGVGKTTVLRLVKNLFAGNMNALLGISFAEIEIAFLDKSKLRARRLKKQGHKNVFIVSLQLEGAGGQIIENYIFEKSALNDMDDAQLRSLLPLPVSAIEDHVPELDQIGARIWIDRATGEHIDLYDALVRYGDRIGFPVERLAEHRLPQKIKNILDRTPVHLIETQRLFARRTAHVEPRATSRNWRAHPNTGNETEGTGVAAASRDMVNEIKSSLSRSGEVSATLDAQFAYKLITGAVSQLDESDIRKRYAEYRAFSKSLAGAGILSDPYIRDLPSEALDVADRKALSLYLQDVERKLEPFKGLLEKTNFFTTLINSRFRRKRLTVDKEKGFILTGKNGEIPSSGLSSGEQHELILMYELLFKVKAKSLILIDEPELSLHVTWQQKFLDDLAMLTKLSDIDFVVATHSPSIVNGRLDLTVELEG